PLPLTADWLRKAFPLVRRVDVEVAVSERIWDLAGMQGAGEWVLLDFPGLGAAESGVRDGFLCERELREVQTILILLDGRTPGPFLPAAPAGGRAARAPRSFST